jgi:hypothetical protein
MSPGTSPIVVIALRSGSGCAQLPPEDGARPRTTGTGGRALEDTCDNDDDTETA